MTRRAVLWSGTLVGSSLALTAGASPTVAEGEAAATRVEFAAWIRPASGGSLVTIARRDGGAWRTLSSSAVRHSGTLRCYAARSLSLAEARRRLAAAGAEAGSNPRIWITV